MDDKDIRYYLTNKKSWNDVTTAVNYKGIPKEGQIINVGKIRMTVNSVIDGIFHGRPIIKVFLESNQTTIENIVESLDNPIFMELPNELNEASGNTLRGSSDKRIKTSTSPLRDTADAIRAYGPGSFGTLGGYIRSALSNLGVGYGVQVSDFGEAITVNITYYNARTGRSAGQSFVLLVRHGNWHKYAYTVYAHSARWRDCNDYNQAIGFIRSKATALAGQTSGAV